MALFSLSKSRNSAFKSADSIDKRLSNTNKVARNIGTTLRNQTVFKKQSIAKRQNIYQKRLDGIRRKDQKDLFEASRSTGAIQRVGRVATGSTKGFLGRILDSISTLLVGWTIINLPKIITLADTLGKRIGSMTGILSSFMNSTFAILQEFGTVTSALIRSLSAFDFSDMGRQIDSSMARVKNAFSQMEIDFFTAITMLTEPIDFEIDEEQEPKPGPGTQQPPGPGTALPDFQSAEMYRIAAALSTEGSGPQSTVDMMQVVVNRKASGRYGSTYTEILSAGTGGKNVAFEGVWKRPGGPKAFRKIQTLEDAVRWSGQSKATLLRIISDIQNPTLQANSAKFVGGAFEFRASPQNNPNGRLPGTAWRGGAGDNQFLTDPSRGDPIRKEGPASFNLPTAVPSSPSAQRPLQKRDIFTQSLGRGVEYIQIGDLYGSRGGRHGGIDIQTPQGTYIALRTPCEVVAQGEYGNYGLLIDVWLPEYGVQLRMAHLSSVLIKSGNIPAGTSFARVGRSGNATGPHIHLEYAKRKGQFSGNAGNPEPYVRLLLLTDKPNRAAFTTPPKPVATPAEISGVPRQQAAAESVTPERQGKTLVVAAPAQLYQNPAMMVGSSGGSQIIISGQGLNNLIKQRMLMELAYT